MRPAQSQRKTLCCKSRSKTLCVQFGRWWKIMNTGRCGHAVSVSDSWGYQCIYSSPTPTTCNMRGDTRARLIWINTTLNDETHKTKIWPLTVYMAYFLNTRHQSWIFQVGFHCHLVDSIGIRKKSYFFPQPSQFENMTTMFLIKTESEHHNWQRLTVHVG